MRSADAARTGVPLRRAARGSGLRRFVVAPLRAGTLGAGVWMWAVGILIAWRRDHLLLRPTEEQALLGAFALASVVVMARGYAGPVRSYLAIAGRFMGGLVASVAVGGAAVAAQVSSRGGRTMAEQMAIMSLVGALFAALAVAWIHRPALSVWLRGSLRARAVAGVAVAALGLVTVWSHSPVARCALGSGPGCRRAALAAIEASDDADGLARAEQGCSLADALSCRIAGDAFWRGYGAEAPARDRVRSEPFYRDACALGDAESCGILHELELQAGCEAQRASACRELASAYRLNPAASSRYLGLACLLGDDAACASTR